MGIVLFYLYDPIFLNHTTATSKLNPHMYIYIYPNNIFHKTKAIPLVLAQLSGNCPLIIETFEKTKKKNLKCLLFINLFKINFE